MADRLIVPGDRLAALATGAAIVAFADRHEVDLNDELALIPADPNPESTTGLIGLVVGLQPAASLPDRDTSIADGDAVILRVFDNDGPVLSDSEFDSQRVAVEAQFR